MKKLFLFFSFILTTLVPVVAFAQTQNCSTLASNPKFQDLICYINQSILAKGVVPLIFALAAIMFFWGVVQYVIGGAEEKEKAKGKQFMIWGIVALAVMVSVWGLVRIATNTFKIDFSVPQVHQ